MIEPGNLTESGERCLQRLVELSELGLPTAQLVTAMGTAVEVHVSGILTRLIALSGVESTKLGSAMLLRLEQDMNKSWQNRATWLEKGFGVEYTGTKVYQDFEVLVELRNSVVHGGGGISDEQARKGIETLQRLRSKFDRVLDIDFRGSARFGPQSSAKAMDIARNFVAEFDRIVLGLDPSSCLPRVAGSPH